MQVTMDATFVDPSRMRLEATADGHALAFDVGGPEGDDSAATPTDTVLGALAGCTAMDVASILRKKRQRADRYSLHLVAEKADEHPRIFTRVVVEHRVEGDVAPEALRRAVELSATRYCPVNAMLSGTVEVEHRYRLDTEGRPGVSELVTTTGPKHRPTTT
jgi:putative redox protein